MCAPSFFLIACLHEAPVHAHQHPGPYARLPACLPACLQRVSAHIGTLIPNFGQHGAHALPKKQQLEEMRQQEQQHQALLRALSEANHRSAMEKAVSVGMREREGGTEAWRAAVREHSWMEILCMRCAQTCVSARAGEPPALHACTRCLVARRAQAQMQALKRRNSQKSLASHRSAKGDGSLRESLQSQGFSHEHRSTKGDSSLRESLHSHGSEHEDAQGRGARVSSDGCAPQR